MARARVPSPSVPSPAAPCAAPLDVTDADTDGRPVVWLRALTLTPAQHALALSVLRSFGSDGPYPDEQNLGWFSARWTATLCARAARECPTHRDAPAAAELAAEIVRQCDAAIPLCATCAEAIGGACGGPDAAWYVAREGEACAAGDHADTA